MPIGRTSSNVITLFINVITLFISLLIHPAPEYKGLECEGGGFLCVEWPEEQPSRQRRLCRDPRKPRIDTVSIVTKLELIPCRSPRIYTVSIVTSITNHREAQMQNKFLCPHCTVT